MSPAAAVAVRSAAPGDAPALSRLLGQLGYPTTPAAAAVRLGALAGRGDTRVLVADGGGGAVGLLALTRMDILPYAAPLARITALCVDEGHRGAGVGRALEAAAVATARAWGCGKIEVTSNRRRAGAHAFYERLGYGETHRFFVKAVPAAPAGGEGP